MYASPELFPKSGSLVWTHGSCRAFSSQNQHLQAFIPFSFTLAEGTSSMMNWEKKQTFFFVLTATGLLSFIFFIYFVPKENPAWSHFSTDSSFPSYTKRKNNSRPQQNQPENLLMRSVLLLLDLWHFFCITRLSAGTAAKELNNDLGAFLFDHVFPNSRYPRNIICYYLSIATKTQVTSKPTNPSWPPGWHFPTL